MKNSKVVFIGPISSKRLGGITVSFNNIKSYLESINKSRFIFINNFFSLNTLFFHAVSICRIFILAVRYKTKVKFSLHCTKNSFFLYGIFLVILKKFFRTEYNIRKFAGSFDTIYASNNFNKKIIKLVLEESQENFFQTKKLVNFFKKYNKRTFWMPTSRIDTSDFKENNFQYKFIYVGKVNESKGINELISKFDEMPDFYQLSIYGQRDENYHHTNLKHYYKGELHPKDVIKKISQYNCFVFLSKWKYEGYPGVIVESFFAGRPIISLNIGGISEMIDNNHEGYILNSLQSFNEEIVEELKENYKDLCLNSYKKSHLFSSDKINKDFLEKTLDIEDK